MLVDQMRKVRKLERNYSGLVEEDCHSGDETIKVGHLSKDVIANNKVSAPSVGDKTSGKIPAKKFHYCRNFSLQGDCRNIAGRLYAGHRDA
jgi:hypothetical protein